MSRRAFTLIELLTVIGILSLLAAMLMPLVGIAQRSAKKSATLAVLSKTDTAIRLFRSEIGVFPYQLDYADPWRNRLTYALGTAIAAIDLGLLQADASAAEAKYRYLAKTSGGVPAEDLVGPPAATVFAFRRSDIHPRWSLTYNYGTGRCDALPWIDIYDCNSYQYGQNPYARLATAATLNRMAGELARLEIFAGNVDVAGLKIATAYAPVATSTTYAPGAVYAAGRDNSGSLLLPGTAAQSRTRPGWAGDYLLGELEQRYRVGDGIVDAYGRPVIYLAQVHEGARFTRIDMFLSQIQSLDLRKYGLHRRGRTRLAEYDPVTGDPLAASAGLPDPANLRHSDRRTHAAPGVEYDIELWSAGPDLAFEWMRDDPANRDNIPGGPYDRELP